MRNTKRRPVGWWSAPQKLDITFEVYFFMEKTQKKQRQQQILNEQSCTDLQILYLWSKSRSYRSCFMLDNRKLREKKLFVGTVGRALYSLLGNLTFTIFLCFLIRFSIGNIQRPPHGPQSYWYICPGYIDTWLQISLHSEHIHAIMQTL